MLMQLLLLGLLIKGKKTRYAKYDMIRHGAMGIKALNTIDNVIG